MVDPQSNAILKRLTDQWDHLNAEIERMNPTTEVYPTEGNVVFTHTGGSQELVDFEIGPVVLNMPERADDTSTDLYVVVSGRISFRRKEFNESKILITHKFASHIAYFRSKSKKLVHVFGAHYDLARDEVGHPIFHLQMKSFAEYSEVVRKHFPRSNVNEVEDLVRGLLRTVRVPTAQMDVFSLFVQLCADHLLNKDSTSGVRTAFNRILAKNDFCRGAAFRTATSNAMGPDQCYRAQHWYPSIV